MATVDQRAGSAAPSTGTARRAPRDLRLALPLALGAVGATWWLLSLTASYILIGLGVYGMMAGIILRTHPPSLPGPGLGAANRVTLGRGALATPIFALAIQPGILGTTGQWWVIALSTAVMMLDGLDGRIARRSGTETRFGARFDMELDAALILALSLIVWRTGKVGSWVLLIGLMRYFFVAAGRLWPVLGAELPPSLRRKAVCVIQGVVLLVALGPIIPVGMAVAVTAAGLAALTCSFAVDVRWTLRRGA